jgi:hypothetical protein
MMDTLEQLRFENKVLHAAEACSRSDQFNLWYSAGLLDNHAKAQRAFNDADLHDPVLVAELKGEFKVLDRIKGFFDNLDKAVKEHDAKLAEAVKQKGSGGSLRSVGQRRV